MRRVIHEGGAVLEEMGWTGQDRAVAKLVRSGVGVQVERDAFERVEDVGAWWALHSAQVQTPDHEPEVPWPQRAVWPSGWRSADGSKVLVMAESSRPQRRGAPP